MFCHVSEVLRFDRSSHLTEHLGGIKLHYPIGKKSPTLLSWETTIKQMAKVALSHNWFHSVSYFTYTADPLHHKHSELQSLNATQIKFCLGFHLPRLITNFSTSWGNSRTVRCWGSQSEPQKVQEWDWVKTFWGLRKSVLACSDN